MWETKHKRVQQNCIRALYTSGIKPCNTRQIPSINQHLYKFGIPFRIARNWLRNNRIYKIISEHEKIDLLEEHSQTQHLNSNISQSIFECMQSFYRSKYYDKLAYIQLLDDQNYWWWRQHFTEIHRDIDDEIILRVNSNEDPLWWQQQVILLHVESSNIVRTRIR